MFNWTDEKIQTVKDLWGKQSAEQIACIIGHHSRNAVCGKAHRLGLSKPFQAAKPKSRATPFRKPRVQRFREVLNTGAASSSRSSCCGEGDPSVMPDCSRPGSHPCTMMGLTNETCRFPLWQSKDDAFLFCGAIGADMANERPYCELHHKMCHR